MAATREATAYLTGEDAAPARSYITRSGVSSAADIHDPLARPASPTFRGSYATCGCGTQIFRRPGSNKRLCDACEVSARNAMKRAQRAKQKALAARSDAVQSA